MESTIGLGTTVEDIKNIGDSLRTAICAYEQRLVLGANKVIEYDFVSSNKLPDSKLFHDFNKEMNLALERLDKDAVVSAIRFLREGIKNRPETSGHEIIQMTKEVCNLFLFSMRNNKFLAEDDNTFYDNFSMSLKDYGSINQLFHYLTTTITLALDKIIEDKKNMDTKPIRDAKKYIQENYKKPITLEEVSTIIGFNATYFSSLFKKDTGYTFLEYVSELRINKAKDLLKETNTGIAVICEQVGYNDIKHFTKTFVKYTGLKPNEYRKLYS
jgi:two-component system response regulator YesN